MIDDILASLAALPPGDAIFDLDGTLIAGDIGESALQLLIRRGPLPAASRRWLGEADPWGDYLALDHVTQCVAAAAALEGLTQADVEAIVDEAFATDMVRPRPEVCELAAAIARRHRVWILTGSAEALGVAVAPRLGIRHVSGVKLGERNGRFTGEVFPPVSCGVGKVSATWVLLGRRPVFSIGDSPWDVHVLRLAHVARTTGRSAGVEFPAFP
jgi:phosphoserine phosphatase